MRGQFHSMSNFNPRIIAGFRPRATRFLRRWLRTSSLVSAKRPKTISARARPPASAGAGSSGASPSAPNQDGCATRFAQTVLGRVVDSVLRLHPRPARFKRGQNTVAFDGNPVTSASPTDLGIPYFFLQILI